MNQDTKDAIERIDRLIDIYVPPVGQLPIRQAVKDAISEVVRDVEATVMATIEKHVEAAKEEGK